MELNVNDYVDYACSVGRELMEMKAVKLEDNAPEFVKENYKEMIAKLERRLKRVEAIRDEKIKEWIAQGEPVVAED